jgi:hypothetical protein
VLGVPGIPFAPTSPVSDNKLGSVLFFPVYTSNATSPTSHNTRINITNASSQQTALVHLYFVDGSNCNVADMTMCLTANQTATFLASDFDPGTTGYLIAVATDYQGCPTVFNALLGDVYVKFSSGHQANLAAEAAAGLSQTPCDENSFVTEIKFDGIHYNPLSRALALSNIPDRASGNDTMIIVNRVGGNLLTGMEPIGTIYGLIYNDVENSFSFSFTSNSCQFIGSLSNTFPRTVPRIEQIIPVGRSGWMKFWAFNDAAIFGAMIVANKDVATMASAFAHGHNLHKLTFTTVGSLTVPVFPPSC